MDLPSHVSYAHKQMQKTDMKRDGDVMEWGTPTWKQKEGCKTSLDGADDMKLHKQ